MPHELTHLVFDTAVKNPYHFPPRWLNEGLAVYLSEGYTDAWRSAVRRRSAEEIIPLDGLAGQFPTTRDQFFLAYGESVSAVDYLVRTFGKRCPGQARPVVRRRGDRRRGVQQGARPGRHRLPGRLARRPRRDGAGGGRPGHAPAGPLPRLDGDSGGTAAPRSPRPRPWPPRAPEPGLAGRRRGWQWMGDPAPGRRVRRGRRRRRPARRRPSPGCLGVTGAVARPPRSSWQITLGVALLALGFLIAAQLRTEGPRVRYASNERIPLVETARDLQTGRIASSSSSSTCGHRSRPRVAGAGERGPHPRPRRAAAQGAGRRGADRAQGRRARPPAPRLVEARPAGRQPDRLPRLGAATSGRSSRSSGWPAPRRSR